ncbi:MAG: hypothetical protein PHH47_07560 [Gallionella sp.]|nr:hypothetical protein [Gallionella sp.]MDD4945354.1 hypothetical protein [Gallionella sp.]MDD5612102.1 hypothetical protein [Gallionella sp.]
MKKLSEETLKENFEKHCEIVEWLLKRSDREHPAVKHHIRAAIREASNHVGLNSGAPKHSAQWMSSKAEESMIVGHYEDLIAEHVVPVSVLNQLIVELPNQSVREIAEILRRYVIRAVITREEDDELKAAGLRMSMPKEWDETDRSNPFARYDAVKIRLVKNRYSELFRG